MKLIFYLAMQQFLMELRINSCGLPLLQTISRTKPVICDNGPVRMWSRIKNINYHQIMADLLHEATTALCVKANKKSNFFWFWRRLYSTSCNAQPTVSKKQNWHFLQNVALSLQCPLWTSLCSEIWSKVWNTGKGSINSLWHKRRANCTRLSNFVGVLAPAHD